MTAQDLAAIQAEQAALGREALDLVVCPLAQPSLLVAAARCGFRLVEFEHVLFGGVPRTLPPPAPAIQVRRVALAEVDVWAAVLSEALGQPRDTGDGLVHQALLADPEVECYLAWRDGEPVGGGGLLVRGGVATLFAMGTRPAFRGLGVHANLLAARCARAHERGAELIVMAVDPGSPSARNLEQHGFRLAYSAALLRTTAPAS